MPTDFDPNGWMKLMRRGGMKYFTFTTKHADGFFMYPTQTKQKSLRRIKGRGYGVTTEDCEINYSIMDTPYKKDIVGMLVNAARKHGLGIGLYFNHFNWHDYDFGWSCGNKGWDSANLHLDPNFTKESDPVRWNSAIEKERQQLTEILTWYGDIDMLCLDMFWPKAAQQDCYEVAKMCRRLQPNVLIRNRGIGPYGDYTTPEQWVPKDANDPKVDIPWQVIYHCGGGFAWLANDNYRPASWILDTLIDSVSKGGNFQVAFGPMPNGKWDPEMVSRVEYVGDWLKVNGEAIYKTRKWHKSDQGDNIKFTRSKDWKYLYVICTKWPGNEINLQEVNPKSGSKIIMLGYKNLFGEKHLKWRMKDSGLTINIPSELQNENNQPCKQAWVFRVELPITTPKSSK
jgi:alpha-L-fucosidase